MKRVVLSLLAAFVMSALPVAQAENISVDLAKDAAAHYMQHNSKLARITPDQLTLARQWNNEVLGVPSMYLFTAPTEGWIIIAATTVMDPIVAFADDNMIDVDNIAPQFEYILTEHNAMVCAVQNGDAEKPLPDCLSWTVLANHQLKGTKANHIFLKTTWDQGGPWGTDYNMYSPVVNDSVAPTGCVATALAQICKYFQYPTQPQGSVNYWNDRANVRVKYNLDTVPPLDYSLMPNSLTTNTAIEKKREISRLGFYVGLAVKMQFGGSLSGSTDENAVNGMKNHFKYSQGLIVSRRYTYDANYLTKTRQEMLQERPIYMSGASQYGGSGHAAGHAWVCDGYRDEDSSMYHMNWGWGRNGGNGFYNLGSNDMAIAGTYYNFNLAQSIITNMIPAPDVAIDAVENEVNLGTPYPNPASLEVVLPYSIREAADMQVYSVSGRLVASHRLQAGDNEITLSVAELPSGIYIYRVGDAHGKFIVR